MNTPTSTSTTAKPSTAWRAHVGGFAWPTLLLALSCVAGFAAVWWATLAGHLSLGLGFVINALVIYLGFTPMHEASHGNVGGRRKDLRWVDDAVGWACASIFAAPYPGFKAVHLRHHGTTNDLDEDPDAWVAGGNPLSIAARCWTILPHYYHSMLVGPISRTKSGADVRRVSIVTLLVFATLTAVLTSQGLGMHALALWWGPAVLASGVLAFLFDWLPHYPHKKKGRYVDTRAIIAPRPVGWALLQQNLHLVHHLYPRVPFYAYAPVLAVIRNEIEAEGAEVRTLFGGQLAEPRAHASR